MSACRSARSTRRSRSSSKVSAGSRLKPRVPAQADAQSRRPPSITVNRGRAGVGSTSNSSTNAVAASTYLRVGLSSSRLASSSSATFAASTSLRIRAAWSSPAVSVARASERNTNSSPSRRSRRSLSRVRTALRSAMACYLTAIGERSANAEGAIGPILPRSGGISCQVVAREGEIPVEAGRIGHRFLVDDLLDRLAKQQLLDRQLLLLARQCARDLDDGEDLVRQEAARKPGL